MHTTAGIVTYPVNDPQTAPRVARHGREEPRISVDIDGTDLVVQDHTRSGAAAIERAWRNVLKDQDQEARRDACGACDTRDHQRRDLVSHRWKAHQSL